MKRQQFRLGSVLHYYELQKQRAEHELQRASRTLQETDAEIGRLHAEIAAVAATLHGPAGADLSVAAWIGAYRRVDHLAKTLAAVMDRRKREADLVAELDAKRRKWSVAEETLCSLEQAVDTFNRTQADKAQQDQLDETVLRQWLQEDRH